MIRTKSMVPNHITLSATTEGAMPSLQNPYHSDSHTERSFASTFLGFDK